MTLTRKATNKGLMNCEKLKQGYYSVDLVLPLNRAQKEK